jgi:beta-xylosidase
MKITVDRGLTEPWRDPSRPATERVADLLSRMTLAEKLAQLGSVWIGASGDGDGVAPMQHEFSAELPPAEDLFRDGMGQLTRVFGTRPVPPAAGMRALAGLQQRIVAASRFGIPAIAHEECLTGFAAWRATIFPAPLAWGASFDPGLVHAMAAAIGTSLRATGVHQGLAPVLDVTRDPRWGRTEETIGEDPYLVGMIGTGYVQGLQSTGVDATLKHFAGYSASRSGRNMAPVSMGQREFVDVILPPFEMAIRLGGARAVMPSYTDLDGVPATADHDLLGRLLRDELGFAGLVVSDYYAVSFLELQHAVAASQAEAAAAALHAGVDVELPAVRCYGAPLRKAVAAGLVAGAAVDRAAARVLTRKCELGLLDPDWAPLSGGADGAEPAPDLDPPEHRDLARRLAEESLILLANPAGLLPVRTWSVRWPTTRSRSSAATACPGTWARTIRRPRRACRSPRCWTRCAVTWPSSRVTRQGARCGLLTSRALPRRSRRPGPRTSWSPWSGTRRDCSGAALPERAATPPTCACRASRRTCWPAWPTPGRRSWPCW